jgi:hypothetical protein
MQMPVTKAAAARESAARDALPYGLVGMIRAQCAGGVPRKRLVIWHRDRAVIWNTDGSVTSLRMVTHDSPA